MSKESAKQFLNEYRDNEEALKYLNECPQPKSQDEAIIQLTEAAGKMGMTITAEEIAEALQEIQEEQKTRTDAATSDLEMLADADVGDVAGGIYSIIDTYTGEKRYSCYFESNRTCTMLDACAAVSNVYYDCSGEYYAAGDEFKCKFKQYSCRTNSDGPMKREGPFR